MQHVAVGIIIRHKQVLLCQRKKGARYELQWEFPGGKVEPGESVEACLRRELQEELSIDAGPIERMEAETSHYDDGSTYKVHYCFLASFSGPLLNKVFEDIRWVGPDELSQLPVLQGNREFVSRLLKGPLLSGK